MCRYIPHMGKQNEFQKWIEDQDNAVYTADKKAAKILKLKQSVVYSYRVGRRQPTVPRAKLIMKKVKHLRLHDFY